jgi:hypothetical protein
MPSKSKKYYDSNPDAKKRKAAYDSLYHSSSERRKYRSKLNKANRKAGTYGNGDDMDMSHTRSGKLVKEHQSRNRARNGSGGKASKKS